jgi:hypothetical protein
LVRNFDSRVSPEVLARAVDISGGRSVVRNYETTIAGAVVPFDPFEVLPLSNAALRARLRVLARPELVAMIQKYDLNPAEKSLTRLSDAQLVTFIVTTVEVQALQGRR